MLIDYYRRRREHKAIFAIDDILMNCTINAHILQAYKEWILQSTEETWNLFQQKFVSLWNEHKNGSGEAYLPAIYNNDVLLELVQRKFMKDLFHDTLGFGAAKMIRCN